MKKAGLFLTMAFLLSFGAMKAQSSYTAAVGLGLDLSEGLTLVGPSGKYFFNENNAGQFDLGFDDGITSLTFLYAYHQEFAGADGLRWFAGAGPSIFLVSGGDAEFALRPLVGLDFKITDVPLAFSASCARR